MTLPLISKYLEVLQQDGESLESYYSRFYKMMNELIRNQCSQELKIVSYHKLYDILKQHQHEVNEIRAERIARVANPLALVAQQQPGYHPQNHPTHYTQNSLTRSQQAVTRNRGKAIVNFPQPIYDQKTSMVAKDDETSKDKEIDKLMALISLSIGNVVGARETVGSTVVQKSGIQCYNCKEFGHVARECQKPKRAKDAAYHREKMLLCKQDEVGIQLNSEQADWRDDTDDDELEDQELEAHYMYMAQLQEVSLDVADSGLIFDAEPLQKVSHDDHYNVFAIESEHPEQSESVHVTYPIGQDAHNAIIDSLDMSYDREEIDQNDDDNDLANERELLASLIEKLKCEIDESKNHNKFLKTSNKKSEAELARRNSMKYASKMEIECAQVRGDFSSYKMEFQKSFKKYTQTIIDLNQTISEMKDKLYAHQETISILSQQKEAQIKLYKTRKDNELDKVIALENKVKVLDNIVYKTGQSVQTMNMLNNKCRTSFEKPEFLKKAQRANPRLNYDGQLVVALKKRILEMVRQAKDAAYHREKMLLCKQEEAARVANPLALVAQQQPVYHPQTYPTHYNQNSSTRTQQAATKNRGKAIVNSPRLSYDQEPSMVDDDDDEMSKDKEIDKLVALISISLKKIYKPTNNNIRTSSNTSRAN
nr:hypothetical protein [Tanacetum cinerariifolium]